MEDKKCFVKNAWLPFAVCRELRIRRSRGGDAARTDTHCLLIASEKIKPSKESAGVR